MKPVFPLTLCVLFLPLLSCETSSPGDGQTFKVTPAAPAPPEPEQTLVKTAPPSVHAEAYVVINPRTGEILLEKNGNQRRAVASTQKLLTALVLLEGGNLERTVTVSASDTYVEPTKMGISAGERYRKRDLLEAMIVRSSNDIAKCLARNESGSEAAFVQQMNAKARQLGMNNSRFVNPHGLTAAGQYSTAHDIATLATHAYNNSTIRRFSGTREIVFSFPDGRQKVIYNTNKVLRMTPYCQGMKTGYTVPAGRCLVSVGQKGIQRVICVVLGSQVPDIWEDSRALLHWALDVEEI
tara:strand:- start:727 stop:1614 length:888 start_codon:yes stop_codon:yes gene_type:complete